jgi:hypothetical protein
VADPGISGKEVIMKLRVHFTNGKKTLVLFWLEHRNSNVYCGYNEIEKISYHESGQLHRKEKEKIVFRENTVPLKEFRGDCMLGGVGIINNPGYFEHEVFFKKSSDGKLDSVLTIDSRSFPQNAQLFVSIGLEEPNRFDILDSRVMGPEKVRKQVKQILISTALEPWVWLTLRVTDSV